ncbi:MAG: PQQ-binding-like beta-propeller repeat protein [Planctomycetes bacterium]|nr:PQQ-binding-like beta-propeller repeat protein [Planctomycetota bacterium]
MSGVTNVRCPHCNSQLRIKSRRLDGKQLKCPRCTQTVLLERVQDTSDYVAVMFFQSHDDRWATTIQPANREFPSRDTIPSTAANTVSYRRDDRDRRWRWPLTTRASAVVVGLSLMFCMLIGGYSVVGNEYRVWQTIDGRRSSIKLAYIAHDDRSVRLKRQDDGREIEMPLAKLSQADRDLVEQQQIYANADQAESAAQPLAGRVERVQPQSTEPTPADWPMWRGPSRDGVVSAGPSLLNSWPSSGPPPLWTSDRIPGEWEGGWGSVSITNGRTYTYVNIPPNKRQPPAYSGLDVVYCLDADSGESIWKFENDGGTHTTPSNGTPCVVNGRVYASGSGGYVYCIDATSGREIWQANTARPNKETSSSFTVADGVAVVLSGPVTGLDAETGEELWSQSRVKSEHSSPAVWKYDGNTFVICNTGNQLTAIEVKSGEIEWQIRSHGGNSTPIVAGDKLVLHGSNTLCAYQLGDSEPEETWTSRADCHGSTPVVYNGFVYSTAAGTALCVRLSDGKTMWREGIGNSNYSSPAIANNKLITVGKNRLLMFGTNTNRLERLDEENMGLVECTSPTIVDGKLYLRRKQNIVCYDLRS